MGARIVTEHGIFAPTQNKPGSNTRGEFVGGDLKTNVILFAKAEEEAKREKAGIPGTYGAGPAESFIMARAGYDLEKILGPQRTIEPREVIDDNTTAIEKLTRSTDDLNRTNQELLSPYYTQDPRTSHIGFRSQGMAAGGYVDVPGGYSANDNMTAIIPVASGERIYVDPMPGRRGGDGGKPFVINSTTNFYGNVDRDQVGRTMYQVGQTMARQLAAASR